MNIVARHATGLPYSVDGMLANLSMMWNVPYHSQFTDLWRGYGPHTLLTECVLIYAAAHSSVRTFDCSAHGRETMASSYKGEV
jgi:hypothetical protein